MKKIAVALCALALAVAATPALAMGDTVDVTGDQGEATEDTTGIMPVYRLYNPTTSEHLWTTDASEVAILSANEGWVYERVGWSSPRESGQPIYRLYNAKLSTHLYTSDLNEIEVLTTNEGWQTDNNAEPLFYSSSQLDGAAPVYRLYNEKLSQHHLTYDDREYSTLSARQGWTQEGVAFYEFSADTTLVASVTCSDSVIRSSVISGTSYLFLPSAVDLTSVVLSAWVPGLEAQTISLSTGDGENAISVAPGETVDLAALGINPSAGETATLHVTTADGEATQDFAIMKASGVSSMFITSDDPDNYGRGYIEACDDHSRSATGSMLYVNEDGDVAYDGVLTQIKGRGNSTWRYNSPIKKPYQIKLDKKTSLITGDKDNASKTWVLLASFQDGSLLRNYISLKSALAEGLVETPDCCYVDLYYDGNYRGTYLLAEKVQVGKGRVDISDLDDENTSDDELDVEEHETATGVNKYGYTYQYVKGVVSPEDTTGGYLVELDTAYYQGETSWFETSVGGFTVKSPEFASEEEVKYFSEYVQEAINEASKQDGDIAKYFDMDSLAKTFLIQAFSKNIDYMVYSSTFFYKDKDNDLIYSGPVWDFDLSYGIEYRVPTGWGSSGEAFFFNNTTFRAAVNERFKDTYSSIMLDWLDETGSVDQSVASVVNRISASAAMNQIAVGFYVGSNTVSDTFEGNVDYLVDWMTSRYEWMYAAMTADEWPAHDESDKPRE